MDTIIQDKKELRGEVLRHRTALPESKIIADSAVIIDKIQALDAYKTSGTVMCFIDFKKEVMTKGFLRDTLALGKRVLVPIIMTEPDGSRTMRASQLLDLDTDLESGTMGILEPKPSCRRFVDPVEIDLFVVPGLAFDVQKNRLGYGAGFHDVMLRKLRSDCVTAAACFDFQVFNAIPVKDYDVPVQMILTEKRTIC
ncbi:5-formyltetrahydrofolate cyclo-ligase [Oscillospiraceae bacterium CM]|nr:5-formyltetrahydrofolate cyclo-ligase [Oscillospiraceae bacterium CM]